MSRRNESVGEFLVKAPWQVSAGLGVAAFIALGFVFPAIFAGNKVVASFALLWLFLSFLAALFLFLLAGLSALFAWRRRLLVDGQTSIESLRALSPKQFEWMVAEAYRRQGYSAEELIGDGPDGGVDVVLRRDGRTTLVQCKRWRRMSVGVPVVREIFGVMSAERADAAIVVTCGGFSPEARSFAGGNGIELVDGPALLQLVRGVQQPPARRAVPPIVPPPVIAAPLCPKCGAQMVKRTARRGTHAGEPFWGCPNYPGCTGKRRVAEG